MLWRKLYRDMREYKAQFLCIFFMAFLGIGIYTGINSSWYGMQESVDHYYEKSALADTWVYGANFNDDELQRVEDLEFIEDTQRRFRFDATTTKDVTLQLNYIENNDISKVVVVEGEAFTQDAEAIYIESGYAKAHNLKIGEQIAFTLPFEDANGKQMIDSKTIKGFITNPEYVQYSIDGTSLYLNHDVFGYAYLHSSAFDFTEEFAYSSLALQTTHSLKGSEITKLKECFDSDTSVIRTRQQTHSYQSFEDEVEQVKTMSYLFPFIFLAIAILSTMTAMIRIVEKQRSQIGILKAIGFKNRQIMIHYISYSFWVSVLGGVLGYFAGPKFIGNLILLTMDRIYTVPDMQAMLSSRDIIVTIIAILIIVVVTYIACRNELKEVIAESLRIKVPKVHKGNILERSKMWKRFRFYTQWNLRDMMRNKVRTLMGLFGVTGSCMLLLCALGLNDTLKSIPDNTYDDRIHYKSKIVLHTDTIQQAEKIRKEVKGQFFLQQPVEIRKGNILENNMISVVENQSYISYQTSNNEPLRLGDNDVAISEKLMRTFGVEINDTIEWRMANDKEWTTSTISEKYHTVVGQGMLMNKRAYEKSGRAFFANYILSKQDKDIIQNMDGVGSLQSIDEAKNDLKKALEIIDTIVFVMVLGSVFLGIVVLYNLGELSLNEKRREFASLKVLGFKISLVAKIFKIQNLWLTLMGMAIGTPFGWWLLNSITSTMQKDFDLLPYISNISYIVVYCGLWILTFFINFIFTKKIKNIDMVESLKGIE
ncbi:MAG: ABC transporter permease [Breznakia sp.]